MESAQGTVDKAIDILFHLHREEGPRGVTEIGHALGLPKSSAHRLLGTLLRRGLVEQDERGRYRPGIGLLGLGLGVLEREPVVVAARGVLEREAAALGETHFLVAARAGELVVLDKVEGTGFLRASPRVGAAVPVHATAVGKLQLAFAPEALGEAQERTAFTKQTVTARSQLEREIEVTRERGFASNEDEWIDGLSVYAAPILRSGRLEACVAIAASSPSAQQLGAAVLAERVLKTAEEIAARLEGRAARQALPSEGSGEGS